MGLELPTCAYCRCHIANGFSDYGWVDLVEVICKVQKHGAHCTLMAWLGHEYGEMQSGMWDGVGACVSGDVGLAPLQPEEGAGQLHVRNVGEWGQLMQGRDPGAFRGAAIMAPAAGVARMS